MGNEDGAGQGLIDSYHESVRKLAVARKCVTAGAMGIVLIAIICVWTSASSFFKTGVAEFSRELRTNLQPSASVHLSKLGEIINKAMPVYTEAFQKVYDRDYPKIEQEMHAQLAGLEAYAAKRWPEFESEISDLALHQQVLIHENLVKLVGEKDADLVAELYRQTWERTLDELVLNGLIDHQNVFDQIRAHIDLIVKQEKEVAPPVELQKAVGMLVEVTGARIQEMNLDKDL